MFVNVSESPVTTSHVKASVATAGNFTDF